MEVPATAAVPDLAENQRRCNCLHCPSNPPEGKGLHCARGLSDQRVRTVGCICTECPVYAEYGLTDGYFCAVPASWWDRFRRHESLDHGELPPTEEQH